MAKLIIEINLDALKNVNIVKLLEKLTSTNDSPKTIVCIEEDDGTQSCRPGHDALILSLLRSIE